MFCNTKFQYLGINIYRFVQAYAKGDTFEQPIYYFRHWAAWDNFSFVVVVTSLILFADALVVRDSHPFAFFPFAPPLLPFRVSYFPLSRSPRETSDVLQDISVFYHMGMQLFCGSSPYAAPRGQYR